MTFDSETSSTVYSSRRARVSKKMANPFPIEIKPWTHDFVKLTTDFIDKYKDSTNEFELELVKIKQLYLKHRNELLQTCYGRYVFVSPEEVVPTELTEIEFGFDNKKQHPRASQNVWGLWYKVGDEYGQPTNALYSASANTFQGNMYLPLSFGKKNTASLWFQETQMLVDTGCVTTTFHLSVLEKIREVYPLFLTATTTINVVGGSIDVQSGVIDIEFCSKEYIMRVNFANIPCIALIGMDLIKDGNLTYDPDNWISFTRHT